MTSVTFGVDTEVGAVEDAVIGSLVSFLQLDGVVDELVGLVVVVVLVVWVVLNVVDVVVVVSVEHPCNT